MLDLLKHFSLSDIVLFIILFCLAVKGIDDQSLDCIQKRYVHYKRQHGNLYVGGLMEDLRSLPKVPGATMKKYNEQSTH